MATEPGFASGAGSKLTLSGGITTLSATAITPILEGILLAKDYTQMWRAKSPIL